MTPSSAPLEQVTSYSETMERDAPLPVLVNPLYGEPPSIKRDPSTRAAGKTPKSCTNSMDMTFSPEALQAGAASLLKSLKVTSTSLIEPMASSRRSTCVESNNFVQRKYTNRTEVAKE